MRNDTCCKERCLDKNAKLGEWPRPGIQWEEQKGARSGWVSVYMIIRRKRSSCHSSYSMGQWVSATFITAH